MRIDDARPEEVAAIRPRTREVRGGGNSRFLVGRDESGAILGGIELLALRGVLDGRPLRIAGLGALFPAPAQIGLGKRRGRGDPAALLEAVLGIASRERAALALVVSEIGPAPYETHGFRALPATEAACRARMPAPWPKEPSWVDAGDPFAEVPGLRPGAPGDLEVLIAIHQEAISGQRFRLDRERAAWGCALSRIVPGHRPQEDGEEQLLVIEERGQVTAYALFRRMPKALRWLEHGARPGSEARLIDLFWCALARARRDGVKRLEGWFLPPAPPGGAFYPIARRTRELSLVMGRVLDPAFELPRFKSEAECRVFELDSF